jgi:hypothetical protein
VALAQARGLVTHERLRFVREPGPWLWLALALGAALRVYLLVFTEGTFDVAIKLHHGTQVGRLGLLEYYRQAQVFNHPPLMGEWFAALARLAEATGIPFRLLLRAPFALLDLGSALLLLHLLRGYAYRYAIFAAYWLHPLAAIYSSYHGNTDSAVAFFALLSVWLASTSGASPSATAGPSWPAAAGAALGVGLWIKLPVLVAAPAILLAFPAWRARWRFAAAAGLVGLAGYLPLAALEPQLLFERIVAYPGSGVETPRGIAIWGIAPVLGLAGTRVAELLAEYNTLVCWVPILVLAWLRRGRLAPCELGASVCGSFLMLYGLTSFWAWQYLAWSVPFWFFLGWRFAALATLLLGGYVYGAYALFTGSPWLLGRWDFVRHGPWPMLLDVLRGASVLLCFVSAGVLVVRAAWASRDRARERAA